MKKTLADTIELIHKYAEQWKPKQKLNIRI